jgi:sRNA-binding protein
MIYKPTRQETEDVIRMLADSYPKCFFEEQKLRRPLKHNILADLHADGIPLAREPVEAAVGWYQGSFGYLYSLQAGAKRIDLNGAEVSTVTEREYMVALAEIKAIKATQHQRRSATETVATLHAAARLSDDDVKKLDAPMIPKATKAVIAPELTKLYEAVMAANATLSGPGDENLRSAMAAAALGFVCKEAQRVMGSLNHQPDESAAKGTAQ